MKRIDQTLLATLSAQAAASPRKRAHHNLHPQLDDKVQRLCIAMEPGTYVRPHRHMQPETWEILLILSGAVALLIFDDSGKVLKRIELAAGGEVTAVEIPANTWHAVASLKTGTVVFEVKHGPYATITEANYAPWSPADGVQAASLESWYHRAKAGDTAPKY
ncbi:protein WbuC [Sulfuricella sp. T08]|uniref:WbuC family cupin fold metalloprotein n=1 Tax=Sulfuricella sp. T08 TaxID=1632857 RepID=UPI000617A0E3|nr:WbuC family cupin fold metalloprotein [Sulfuricella sp. T08]GAO35235.1 protein WbuC [Sulfuricella sp. T08]